MGNDTGFGAKYANEGYLPPAIWQYGYADRPWGRSTALNALLGGAQVVYAMRLPDGVIKIGCCKILGFRRGTFDDERAIHATLKRHLSRGREYYHPHLDVMAFVNGLRDEFGLPHIAA